MLWWINQNRQWTMDMIGCFQPDLKHNRVSFFIRKRLPALFWSNKAKNLIPPYNETSQKRERRLNKKNNYSKHWTRRKSCLKLEIFILWAKTTRRGRKKKFHDNTSMEGNRHLVPEEAGKPFAGVTLTSLMTVTKVTGSSRQTYRAGSLRTSSLCERTRGENRLSPERTEQKL
jgi:hypothetical protein